MKYMPKLSLSVWATLALLVGGAVACLSPAWSADQKPLVINPTTGKQEQLQPGNSIALPDASGDLLTINTGVQTAARTITYPVLTGNRTLAVLDQQQTFTQSSTWSGANILLSGSAVYQHNRSAAGSYLDFQWNSATRAQVEVDSSGNGLMNLRNASGSAYFNVGQTNITLNPATSLVVGSTANLRVINTTSATSSISGAVVVGDGSTAATNVGIGGGRINAGSTASSTTDSGNAIYTPGGIGAGGNVVVSSLLKVVTSNAMRCGGSGSTYFLDLGTVNLRDGDGSTGAATSGKLTANSTEDATSTSTGSLIAIGGVSAAKQIYTNSNVVIATTAGGLKVKEGTNARMGAATLVAGTVTVNTTAVTANSRIYLTSQADGGTPGFQRISARSAGTSFTITSSSGTDTSTVAWMIVEPSP